MGDAAAAAALRLELSKKQHELQQLQDSFDEYTQSSHELEQELEQELARAELISNQLTVKAHRLECELDQMRHKLDATQHEMRKCESELQSLRVELTRVTQLKRQLEQEQDELTTQVRILQATEDDLRHKMEREMEEKVFLISDQEELKREHELVTERLRTEIMDLKSELFAVQQKNEQLQVEAEKEQERKQERALQEEQDEQEEDPQERDESDREQLIETLEKELDVLSVRLQEETDARERLEMEFLDAQDNFAQAEAMETEMTEMADELIEKSQEIRQRDLEIQSLQEVVKTLKMEISLSWEANAQLQATISHHETIVAAASAARHASSEGNEIITTLRNQCVELEDAERQLREQLQDEQLRSEQLLVEKNNLVQRVDENARLRNELEDHLDALVKTKQRELNELMELNTTLRRQLETAAQKAAQLEEEKALAAINNTNSNLDMSAASSSPVSSSSSTASSFTAEARKGADEEEEEEARRKDKQLQEEIQTLRAAMNSLQAENARLRHTNNNITTTSINNQEPRPSDNIQEALPTTNKRVSTDLLQRNYSSEQLAKKYISERTRNAALLSRLQTVCGNIQVFCRVRPMVGHELTRNTNGSRTLGVNVINQSDVASLDIRAERVFPTASASADSSSSELRSGDHSVEMADTAALMANASWKVFTFDRVIGPEESQMDVFREVEPIAQSVVEGFKACIFAYGQTGSGKTHTMEGTESDPGLTYRVVNHMFQSIVLRGSIYDPTSSNVQEEEEAQDEAQMEGDHASPKATKNELCYHLQVGVLEIYNETLRDLVDPDNKKPLEIRQDSATGDIVVPELTMATTSSPEQTISILRRAQANRVTGETGVHAHSSRSHSVVIFQISTRRSADDDGDELMESYVSGKLYMVDLAGSERVKKSNVSGVMLKEAAHINKSLSALADVMEALDKKQAHVPYRNSKLTYLLQDVLNTSCKTVMIVNCGPTLESASETFRSLQLAERVRNIVVGRNSIVKNKKDVLSAKRAFSEIQSLKQQIQASARKFKQSQQTVLTLKREQKTQSDQVSSTLQSRAKVAEKELVGLKNQSETLKRLNDELTEQLKQERDAKQKETEQRDAAQRMLRQLNTKTRVSTSHQELLERQLKDREDEIKKLRQMLTEARQRTATSVIPRHKGGGGVTGAGVGAGGTSPVAPARKVSSSSSSMRMDDLELMDVDSTDRRGNQEEEDDEDGQENKTDDNKQSSAPAPATRIPRPRFAMTRQSSSLGSSKRPSSIKSGGGASGTGTTTGTGAGAGASRVRRMDRTALSMASTSGSTATRQGWK